jgi:hypothetical protein
MITTAANPQRRAYLVILTWVFTLFSAGRLLAYLPIIHAIHASGDSSQHALFTWIVWCGANASMAAWLYETNEHRVDTAVLLNGGNASMCLLTAVLIGFHRLN